MADIQIFNNDDFGEVRAKVINGEPNFVAKDICDILELSSVTKSLERVKDRWVNKIQVPHPQSKTKKIEVNAVTEPGLYKLVFRSNKNFADKFSNWVAEEVNPSIRKTGSYAINEKFEVPDNLADALELAAEKEIGPEQEKKITKRMMEAAAYIYNYELNWKGEMKAI